MDAAKLSDQELLARLNMPPSLPVKMGGYVDDIGVTPMGLSDVESSMGLPPSADASQLSDQDLLSALGQQAQPANPLQNLQAAFDQKKSGLGSKILSDIQNRTGKMQGAIDAYNLPASDPNSIGPAEGALRFFGQGANAINDAGTDAVGAVASAIADRSPKLKRIGNNVLNYVSDSPVGDAARLAAGKYAEFAQAHPRAAENLAAAGGLMSVAGSLTPVGGMSAAEAAAKGTGKALQVAGKGVDLVRPGLGAEQKTLQNMGVRLTGGQRSGGILQSLENKATSIPIVGDLINSSYKRGIDDFNRGVANEVTSSIGVTLPKDVATGHDAIAHTKEAIRNSYDSVLSKMKGQLDQPFAQDLDAAMQKANQLPDTQIKQIKNILDDIALKRIAPTGAIKGDQLKEIQSRLRFEADNFRKSPDPDHQRMAEIFEDVRDSFSSMLGRTNPPDLTDQLKNTDLAFAKFVRQQKAAGSIGAGNNEGIFTPAQLMSAVRSSDGSVRKGQFAQGDALMQGVASAGQKVLPNKIPDSGTAGRAMLQVATGAGLAGGSVVSPIPLLLGAIAAGAYTRPGQAVLRGVSKVVRK